MEKFLLMIVRLLRKRGMNKKEIIKILMNVINPKFRNDWDLVNWHFKEYFKFKITKKDWEEWKKCIEQSKI